MEDKAMSEEIFRKKSLDKIKSPECLDDYVRVTNPTVWLLFAAVIILLVGAVIWGTFGHIVTNVDGDMHVKNGEAFCYVAAEDISGVEVGMNVESGDAVGTVTEIDAVKSCVNVDIDLDDGHYDAKIIVESIRPASFVVN